MELAKLATSCDDEHRCPAVYATDRGTIAVQGPLVAGIDTPSGEAIVEIPSELFLEASRATQ